MPCLFWRGLGGWTLLVSLLSAAVTVWDKAAARRHRRRVPERVLFCLSAAGGSGAMYLTMRLIHHKTRKRRFMVGIPLILLAQAALTAALWRWGGALF